MAALHPALPTAWRRLLTLFFSVPTVQFQSTTVSVHFRHDTRYFYDFVAYLPGLFCPRHIYTRRDIMDHGVHLLHWETIVGAILPRLTVSTRTGSTTPLQTERRSARSISRVVPILFETREIFLYALSPWVVIVPLTRAMVPIVRHLHEQWRLATQSWSLCVEPLYGSYESRRADSYRVPFSFLERGRADSYRALYHHTLGYVFHYVRCFVDDYSDVKNIERYASLRMSGDHERWLPWSLRMCNDVSTKRMDAKIVSLRSVLDGLAMRQVVTGGTTTPLHICLRVHSIERGSRHLLPQDKLWTWTIEWTPPSILLNRRSDIWTKHRDGPLALFARRCREHVRHIQFDSEYLTTTVEMDETYNTVEMCETWLRAWSVWKVLRAESKSKGWCTDDMYSDSKVKLSVQFCMDPVVGVDVRSLGKLISQLVHVDPTVWRPFRTFFTHLCPLPPPPIPHQLVVNTSPSSQLVSPSYSPHENTSRRSRSLYRSFAFILLVVILLFYHSGVDSSDTPFHFSVLS